MRKPTFSILENKGADQPCGNGTFIFTKYLIEFLKFLNLKLPASSLAIFCICTARFVSDLVGIFEYLFSHDVAQIL